MPAPENVKWYFQFLIHSAFAQLAVDIDQNLQRNRAVSLRQHGFLVSIGITFWCVMYNSWPSGHESAWFFIWFSSSLLGKYNGLFIFAVALRGPRLNISNPAINSLHAAMHSLQIVSTTRDCNPGTIFQSRDFGIEKRQSRDTGIDPGIPGLIPGLGTSNRL